MDLPEDDRRSLLSLLDSRGAPQEQLISLRDRFGEQPVFAELERLAELLTPVAGQQGLSIQLDTTFQPVFDLYTGLVFQLVCQGKTAPVVIARGGRYDDLVRRCGGRGAEAAGLGFSFAIDPIRELLSDAKEARNGDSTVLVAYSDQSRLETALKQQRRWHQDGQRALVELNPLKNRELAERMAEQMGAQRLDWIET